VRLGVHAESEAGSAPLDLVLFLVVAAIIAVGAWYTVQSGGLLWLVVWLAVGITVVAVVRPVFRRRRVDAESRHRQVGHDDSWTSGKEEE
jgi:hypothetical protein